jgi:hypothetical protein
MPPFKVGDPENSQASSDVETSSRGTRRHGATNDGLLLDRGSKTSEKADGLDTLKRAANETTVPNEVSGKTEIEAGFGSRELGPGGVVPRRRAYDDDSDNFKNQKDSGTAPLSLKKKVSSH